MLERFRGHPRSWASASGQALQLLPGRCPCAWLITSSVLSLTTHLVPPLSGGTLCCAALSVVTPLVPRTSKESLAYLCLSLPSRAWHFLPGHHLPPCPHPPWTAWCLSGCPGGRVPPLNLQLGAHHPHPPTTEPAPSPRPSLAMTMLPACSRWFTTYSCCPVCGRLGLSPSSGKVCHWESCHVRSGWKSKTPSDVARWSPHASAHTWARHSNLLPPCPGDFTLSFLSESYLLVAAPQRCANCPGMGVPPQL